MKAILSPLSVGLAVAIVVLGTAAPKANAVVIYDWSGLCDFGCAGQATAVLTLADSYVPGSELVGADFISFSYSSSSGAYDIPADEAFDSFVGAASLPAVSGQADIAIGFAGLDTTFTTVPNFWTSLFAPTGISDGGGEYQWVLRRPADLPAPGPLSLLALGLAGLALARRRRTNANA